MMSLKVKGTITETNTLIIPKFTLQLDMKKYGHETKCIEAPVIIIKCALKDVSYLKTLFTYGYKTGKITIGEFAPSGIHLSADVDMYKRILCDQKQLHRLSSSGIHKRAYSKCSHAGNNLPRTKSQPG
eukprot:3157677-Ditylum_brightwellii.AAC.1